MSMDCDSVEARSKLARVCNALEKKVLHAKMADMNAMYNLASTVQHERARAAVSPSRSRTD